MTQPLKQSGFTIVELAITISVIAILTSIVVVANNSVSNRAKTAKRNADMAQLLEAIDLARLKTNQSLGQITSNYWSSGRCTSPTHNTALATPKDLPKTHVCWTLYQQNIDRISAASGIDLRPIRDGDANGNPYTWDENEGEAGDLCRTDSRVLYFTNSGVATAAGPAIPKHFPSC